MSLILILCIWRRYIRVLLYLVAIHISSLSAGERGKPAELSAELPGEFALTRDVNSRYMYIPSRSFSRRRNERTGTSSKSKSFPSQDKLFWRNSTFFASFAPFP